MSDSQQVSPLDKYRGDLSKNKIKLIWDLEGEDPVATYKILKFLLNLVEQTPASSRLAYQICHYMELDCLDIPGLVEIFPTSRKQFKAAQKEKNKERKKLEAKIKSIRVEVREIKGDYKKEPLPADLQTMVDVHEEDLEKAERAIQKLDVDSEYKDLYPMKAGSHIQRKGAREEDWKALKEFLVRKTKKAPQNKDSNFIRNAEMLCDHLGFSQIEKEALIVNLLISDDPSFDGFTAGIIAGKRNNAYAIFAKMLGVERDVVSKILSAGSPLVEKGILIPVTDIEPASQDHDCQEILPSVSGHLIRVLKEPDLTLEGMMRHFIGEPAKTHLDWDKDFAYLGEGGNELIRMLEGAKTSGKAGVNVLLYGLPGTGKTEAVKAAAKKVGLELYIVGEKGRFGNEPSRRDRITAAILAQELLSDNHNAAILLDEMEDLFPAQMSFANIFGGAADDSDVGEGDKTNSASKVFLNRLLERNGTITFWAANRPDRFEAAFRRRILYSLEFRVPPATVRENIWASVSAKHNFTLSAQDQQALARSFVVPPGLMDNAIRHASLSGGGLNSIHTNLRAASSLMFGSRRIIDASDKVPSHYDLRFLNTTVEASEFSIVTLGDNIKASGRRNFNMLLNGPPGSGKSQYLMYLANLLGMDVLLKDAAALNDKYVGETEKRISDAFAEAEEREMFLIIDEADTFLRRRDELGSNYEITAVNTMLVCMERHTQPFGCTTNLFQNIDPAAKRRFLFKVAFDYLTPDQKTLAFDNFFGMQAPETLKVLTNMVPSDFVNVKKQIDFIPGDVTADRLVRLLSLEVKSRMDANANLYAGAGNMGFFPKHHIG